LHGEARSIADDRPTLFLIKPDVLAGLAFSVKARQQPQLWFGDDQTDTDILIAAPLPYRRDALNSSVAHLGYSEIARLTPRAAKTPGKIKGAASFADLRLNTHAKPSNTTAFAHRQ
jgi:hypothetical protein